MTVEMGVAIISNPGCRGGESAESYLSAIIANSILQNEGASRQFTADGLILFIYQHQYNNCTINKIITQQNKESSTR